MIFLSVIHRKQLYENLAQMKSQNQLLSDSSQNTSQNRGKLKHSINMIK